jgi:cbb3-type cytochrome oxidase subunit 3
MHRDLLAQSPLLVLPLVAMFLFIAVWVVSAVRVLTRSRVEMEKAARLPLDDKANGDEHEHR